LTTGRATITARERADFRTGARRAKTAAAAAAAAATTTTTTTAWT